jgi:hypothetical protein
MPNPLRDFPNGPDPAEQFEPAAVGQADIAQENVKVLVFRDAQRFGHVLGGQHLVAEPLQEQFHRSQGVAVILHDQDAPLCVCIRLGARDFPRLRRITPRSEGRPPRRNIGGSRHCVGRFHLTGANSNGLLERQEGGWSIES